MDTSLAPCWRTTLEPQAQSIIDHRHAALHDWGQQMAAAYPAWYTGPQQLDQLEPMRIPQADLRALAEQLGLFPLAQQTVLRQCHQQGCFDRPMPHAARIDRPQSQDIQPVQPDRTDILPRVRALFQRIPDRQERIDALVRQGCCRNRGNAQAVVALIEQHEHNTDTNFVLRCMRDGHLAQQPDAASVVEALRAVVRRTATPDQQIQELVQTGLSPSHEHAHIVIDRFAQRNAKSDRYRDTISKCLQRGLFKTLPARPAVDELYQRIAAIFAAVTDEAGRSDMLLWAGICQSAQQAQQVVQTQRKKPPTKKLIEQCWSAGHFDMLPTTDPAHQGKQHQPYAIRPSFPEVAHHITILRKDSTDPAIQVQALIAVGYCRDEAAAHAVVAALDQSNPNSSVNRIAAALAQRLLASYREHGPIGLLAVSEYAPAETLFFVQRAIPAITTMSNDPMATLALFQRDLVALYRAFEQVDGTLWTRDLLDSPIVSANRTRCQRRIAPEQRTRIIATLQAQHPDLAEDAATIHDLLVERSGFGLIDWRCGVPFEQAGHAWEQQRLRRILEHHLGALTPQALDRIESDVLHLKAAMQASGVTISLVQLLNSQPSSAFRKRLNRRLPVGYGQVQFFRRNETRQRHRRHGYRARVHTQHQTKADDPLARASALVQEFATRTALTEREAAHHLYQVRTYGGIGFLPKGDWLGLIDARLLALLKFYTFVRIEGRLNAQQAVQQVNTYAEQLDLKPISAQLARALNGVITKPRRWNSGESARIATVRRNAGVVLPGTPWLHRVWRLFHMPLNLPVAASPFSAASETSHLLLVVDLGSQLPTGLWVSAHPPGSAEVGLALFQAIWHPGALDWPLRGAPEVLQVPASLRTAGGGDFLEHAAAWLCMQVQVVADEAQATTLRKLPILQALIDAFALVGLDEIQRNRAGRTLTVKDAQDAVLGWIRTSEVGFAHHTPGLPDTAAQQSGYAAPAFDTPAAGLLLPITGEATTVRDGVVANERRYASSYFRSEPGHTVAYRAFPYRYGGLKPGEGMQEAIYVEDGSGLVQYVTRRIHDE